MLSAREDYVTTKFRIRELDEELRQARLKNEKDEVERLEGLLKIQATLLAWHTQSQNASRLNATVSLLTTRLTLALTQLDADPWLLNVANGTIDLRTATLLPHAREHYLTQQTPVEWDETATCPTWDGFLRGAMGGDLALVLYLARAVGYSLTGLTTEQCLFFCYGLGRNGKSTFLTAIKNAMGDYACAAPRDLLMVQKTPRHETEYARLLGKRLATGREVGEGERFDEPKVKDLTGSDVIAARRMNEDYWDLVPTHKLWLGGNYRPTVIGADLGIWRRIRLIPWTVTVPEEERDPDLPAKLQRELSGILRWIVSGCLEWQRIGLSEPTIVVQATEAYRVDSDILGAFLRDHCVFDPEATVSKPTLRERYEQWCRDSGHEAVGGRRMATRLRERDCVECHVREGGKERDGWRGVRLLRPEELYVRSVPAFDEPLS
jgi:putative DNA primase/helicase